ncbi:hypothetical protein Lal_00028196 [Lupinus albus]|nr:hypothetical protein Lal_00028196 [Lupinus albus]
MHPTRKACWRQAWPMAYLSHSNATSSLGLDASPGKAHGSYPRLAHAVPGPPQPEVDDHHAGIEVTRPAAGEARTVSEPSGVAASLAMSSTRTKSESRYTILVTQRGSRFARANGGGDEASNGTVIEGVRERSGEGVVEDGGGGRFGGGGDKMKNNVFWTRGVLKNGEDGGHGATEVSDVEGQCHVDCDV